MEVCSLLSNGEFKSVLRSPSRSRWSRKYFEDQIYLPVFRYVSKNGDSIETNILTKKKYLFLKTISTAFLCIFYINMLGVPINKAMPKNVNIHYNLHLSPKFSLLFL